jgi:hypothetical protein
MCLAENPKQNVFDRKAKYYFDEIMVLIEAKRWILNTHSKE